MNSSTDEEENFFRLYKLVVGIGTKAVRENFDQSFPPNSLYSTLKSSETALRRNLRIRPDQDALLFPSSGMPSSNAFDLTLMISLIRNLNPPCPPPIQGYDELPSPTETSLAADFARIKWYRNSFSHAGKPEIDTSKYINDWQVLSETITRIGGPTYKLQCDTLRASHLTFYELNCLRKELVQTNKSIERMCTLIDAVADKHKRLEADTKTLIEVELSESTFVETKASSCALELLKKNGVVLITGGAGTGKSRMGLMVLHHFQLLNSQYHAIKLSTIDEWQTLDKLNEDYKIIVLVDDIFGETNCTFNKERNEPILDKIYAYVQKGNVKVVITIRNTVKQHCAEIFENHRLFRFDLINLNAPQYHLLLEEKKDMLVRHFARTREGVQLQEFTLIDKNEILLTKDQLIEIMYSNPVLGFPLTVYRFVNNIKFLQLKSIFFTSRTDATMEEVNTIRRKGKDNDNSSLQYAVLVYTALNENSINNSDDTVVDEILSIVDAVYGKKIRCTKRDVSDSIADMLDQRYLMKDPSHPCFHFSHITLQESVILSFADADANSMNKIIQILSLPFIVNIARSKEYMEKEGEVVLKVPQKCYSLLAERVVKLILQDVQISVWLEDEIHFFMNSEIFEKVGNEVLGQMVDSYFTTFIRSYDIFFFDDECYTDIFGVFCDCLPALLLKCSTGMKGNTSNVVLPLLRKVAKEINALSNNNKIVDKCKSGIVCSLYEIFSRQDVEVVTEALNIAKEGNIHISEDQFLAINEMHESTLYIYQCISESYCSSNMPVMRHFCEKLKDKTFDVNLFLKRIYADGQKRMSLESIDFLRTVATFDDKVIDWLIKLACKRHWLPEVKYFFASKDKTDTNTVYIECFLHGYYCDKMENAAEECRALFKFLMSQFYHNVERIDRILNMIKQSAMHCGGLLHDLLAVVDRRLLHVNKIASLACETSDVQTVKWVFNSIGLEHIDIKEAFIKAVNALRNMRYADNYPQSRLGIINYLLTFINISEFNFKDVLYSGRNYSYFRQDPFSIEDMLTEFVNNALQHNECDFLMWIIVNGDKLHLDYNIAMIALCRCCTLKTKEVKTLIEKLWQHVDDKEIFDQKKIVDEACKHYVDHQMCIWFLDVFDHKLIDINKILTISYRYAFFNVVKYIVEKVDPTLFEININLFLKETSLCSMDKNEMVSLFLLSKSGFTDESLQTLMNKAISCTNWNLVQALLIYRKNDTRIFDIKTIVHACCASGKVDFLSSMISNEGTKHCIQFIDIDLVMTEACCRAEEGNLTYIPTLLTQIWNKKDHPRCDWNIIIKKMCFYKRLHVCVLNWILDKVDKDKIDVNSAFVGACQSKREDTYMYNHSLVLVDFLLQKCGADMFNISKGVGLAIQNTNYKLVHYFLAKGLCKGIVIDMKSLLNNACSCGKYDLAVWIMQNIEHSDLDLSSAFINACIYGSTEQFMFWNIGDDFVLFEPFFDKWKKRIIEKYQRVLWCAMLILDKIDNLQSLNSDAALSIARNKGDTRMGQWLQYIFKSQT